MKRILVCLLLISCPVMADTIVIPELPRLGWLQAKTEWQNNQPALLWLRWLDSKNNILCYHFMLGAQLGVLPTEWTDVEDIALKNLGSHNLIDNTFTDAQKTDCFTTKIKSTWLDQIANVPPPPTPTPTPTPTPAPTTSWKVAVNGTFPDRPMDNPDFTTMKGQRAKVGDPCENEIIKTISSKQSWHFTKSTTGVRGLAVCEVK